MGPEKVFLTVNVNKTNIFLHKCVKRQILIVLNTKKQMLSVRDRYVRICMRNVDIRKLIHALDEEDNYDTVERISITHTDFSTNFLKTLLFGTFLGCVFYYLQSLSCALGIPCW
jgi:hypothetical protein